VQAGRAGFGQRRVRARHAVRHRDQVARRDGDLFGESAGTIHADQVALGAQVLPAAEAGIAHATGDQRIEHHALAAMFAFEHGADGLVTEYQRRYAALVVAEVSMHIGTANAHRLDRHQRIAGLRRRLGLIAVSHFLVGGINQCFHDCLPAYCM